MLPLRQKKHKSKTQPNHSSIFILIRWKCKSGFSTEFETIYKQNGVCN